MAQIQRADGHLRGRAAKFENLGVILIMLVFIIVVLVFSGPKFLNPTNITNLLRSIAVTGIAASALTLVMIAGKIDLSVGWLVGFAACLTGVHSDNAGSALFLSLGLCALCGALNGFLVGILKLNPFITTLGTMYVFKGVAMMYSNGVQLTTPNPSALLKFIGQGYLLGIPTPVWIFALTSLIFLILLRRCCFGSNVYAVGANAVAARFSGVSPAKVIMICYVLAGLAAGLAGVVLYAKVMSTQAYSGVGLEFDALTAIVIGGVSVSGGKGNVTGTILGVLFVGVLANGFTLLGLGSNAQYIVQGFVLLAAMRADVMRVMRMGGMVI
jgi:ribose/xylose/arabinose/galactoside ABC-type transport system permease subunit